MLAAALVATILISALLASLFFAVTEETRSGAAIERGDQALAAAETAIESGLKQARHALAEDQPSGTMETHLIDVEGFPTAVHLTRLDSSLVWLVAVVGDARNPSLELRRVGVLAEAFRQLPDSITIVRIPRRGWSELY